MNRQSQWLFEAPVDSGDYMARREKRNRRIDDNSLPQVERVGRSQGNAPRNNQDQNRQINSLANKLTPQERRRLHDQISGQGYSYQQIKEIIQSGDFFLPEMENKNGNPTLSQFGRSIPLNGASTHADVVRAVKGLYVIFRDRALVYLGQSGNLASRLRSHRLSLRRFKIPTNNYSVRILPMPGSTPASRVRREQFLRSTHRIALAHQRATSEAEYLFQ
jgi:hypothetical protein